MTRREPGDPIRVLLVTGRAPDARGLGGVEVHVADLAHGLPANVEPFGVHQRSRRWIVEAFRPRRHEIAALPPGELDVALVALGIDVLHVHSPQIASEELARAAGRAGVPLVVTLHDLEIARTDASAIVERAELFVAPSRFIRDAVAERYACVRARAHIIEWGVPPQRAVPLARGGPLGVAFVGVLAADKGAARIPDLVRACRGLDVEWHLFGATEGRRLSAIRAAAPRVRAHGSYRRSELGAALARARVDVAVIASVVPESFSMTLSECAAARVPVLASDVGALGERVQSLACGWTFDAAEPAAFAAALARLADRREIATVKQRIRAVRTPAQMAADHVALYREAAARRRPAAPDVRRAAEERLARAPVPRGRPIRLAWNAVKRTRLYRDLPLRRLLPEPVRGRIERGAMALLDRFR